jgi:hypothetical protein
MIKKDLIELNATLIKLSNFGKTKFKYAVLKNIEILKSNINILQELENSVKKHLEPFEKSRNEIIIEIGKRKDDGTVFIDINNKEMVTLFNEKLTQLLKTHEEDLKTYNSKMVEYQEMLEEEIDEQFAFKLVSIDQLPEEDVSIDQLNSLEKYGIITE